MKLYILILSCCLGLPLGAEEARIWVDALINSQRVRLIFDTGASDPILFRGTAERLKLKVIQAPPGLLPSPGSITGPVSEPVDFASGTLTGRVQFGVSDLPASAETEADGALSWYPLKHKVLIFDATTRSLTVGDSVPQGVRAWSRFKQRTDARYLGFEIDAKDPGHRTVYVDTGAEDGVCLSRPLWEKWAATHANRGATMRAFATPAAGLLVKEEAWANEMPLGSLVLTGVPVRELDAKEESPAFMPHHAATLGLFALRRLELVVDGAAAIVYARPTKAPVPAYPHNQLGAVFIPRDDHADSLVAHVALGSPAYLAGIRDSDVLLRIDDLDVTKWRTDPAVMPLRRFWEGPVGTRYKLNLKRGEREYQTAVVLKRILGPQPQGGP